MKRNLLLFIALTFIPLINIYSQCAATANIYSFSLNGKNYEIVKEAKSWTDAAACALQKGGHLVYINSKAENDSIYNRIIQGAGVSTSYTSVGDGGGASYLWIGGTDKFTEGTWIWDGTNSGTGTNFWNGQGAAGAGGGSVVGGAFINWGGTYLGPSNEPDNYGGAQNANAIALTEWPLGTTGSNRLGIPSEWNDLTMTNLLYYIIEYEPTGINQINKPNEIEIYPNPAKDNFTIKTNLNTEQRLEITNLVGQTIYTTNINNKTTINSSAFANGVYILKLYNDKETIVKKFVKG